MQAKVMDAMNMDDKDHRNSDTPASNKGGAARTPMHRRDLIDENIRHVYDDLLDDEVPDRFQQLLAQLREQDADKGEQK